MSKFRRRLLGKMLALCLVLMFALTTAAYALTPDQFKLLLQEYYLDGVSDDVMQQETIEGIITALGDPYTKYMSPKEYQSMIDGMSDQEIGGVGISVQLAEQGLLLVEVYEGGPAAALGMQVGDVITAVDGKSAAGHDSQTITAWLRGEVGTKVSLQVLHADGRLVEYSTQRKLIVIPATTSQLIDERVGYINCKVFGEQTLSHFLEAMKTHTKASTWMVDLRSNLGGDLNAVSQTLGAFLGTGKVVYLRDGKDQYLLYESQQEAQTIQPTIILTSPWTASAAEIFSAAMRDKKEGLLVGEKTYGKGVAQAILDDKVYPQYFTGGDAVKITAFRYFTMGGSTADHVGVIPHLLVDAYNAGEIAMLLTETDMHATENSQYLRLHLGYWRWYLDLKDATSPEKREYFTKLLEALPPNTVIKQGNDAGSWLDVTVQSLVKTYGLASYETRNFADVQNSPYRDDLNTLGCYDILRGYEGGVFRPEGTMTRAELSALLVQAFGLPTGGKDSAFSDVDAKAWYADEVKAVAAAGLMEGVGGGEFAPQGTVSEEELITVLARASASLNAFLHETLKTWDPTEMTVPEGYSEWSRKWVWLLSESQINVFGQPINLLFSAPDGIAPHKAATREEAGATIRNILSFANVLPN